MFSLPDMLVVRETNVNSLLLLKEASTPLVYFSIVICNSVYPEIGHLIFFQQKSNKLVKLYL